MNKFSEKALTIYHDWQMVFAVLIGAVLQSIMAEKRNRKTIALIFFSAFFVALYVTTPFIEYSNVENEYIISAMYAFSSLLSVELLSLFITILPKGIRHKLNKVLDLEESENDTK